MSAVELDALKAHLNIDRDGDDEELQEHLDAAIDLVEQRTGPLTPVSVVELQAGDGGAGVVVLGRAPVVSVESLGGYEADAYLLDQEAGIVTLLGGRRAGGDLAITYTAGRAAVPSALRRAVLIIAKHLWETQRVPGAGQAGFGQAQSEATRPGAAWAVPNRAAALMGPYLLPSLP